MLFVYAVYGAGDQGRKINIQNRDEVITDWG